MPEAVTSSGTRTAEACAATGSVRSIASSLKTSFSIPLSVPIPSMKTDQFRSLRWRAVAIPVGTQVLPCAPRTDPSMRY
jgi:hypothetical protein